MDIKYTLYPHVIGFCRSKIKSNCLAIEKILIESENDGRYYDEFSQETSRLEGENIAYQNVLTSVRELNKKESK